MVQYNIFKNFHVTVIKKCFFYSFNPFQITFPLYLNTIPKCNSYDIKIDKKKTKLSMCEIALSNKLSSITRNL